MKRTCLYILLALCAMALLASCDPQINNSPASKVSGADVSTPVQGGTPTVSVPSSDTPSASDSQASSGQSLVQQEQGTDISWYGEWRVEDYIFSAISAMSEKDAQAMLGEVVCYGKDEAVSQGKTYAAPYYSAEPVLAEDFYSEYRGQLTFGDIWLDGESTEYVVVNNASFFGDRFYVRDMDSLVIGLDGAYFLARRVEKISDEMGALEDHCYDVWLNGWGDVRFVSALPVQHEDVVFFLTQNDEIVYTFPAVDGSDVGRGLVDAVESIIFRDVNGDGQTDVVTIVSYVTGAGPQGMEPQPALCIYLQDGKRFTIASELIAQVEEYVDETLNGRLTMDAVQSYFGLNET